MVPIHQRRKRFVAEQKLGTIHALPIEFAERVDGDDVTADDFSGWCREKFAP